MLKNNVMVSFNTTVRQITDIFQWPKCLSKKRQKYKSWSSIFLCSLYMTDT